LVVVAVTTAIVELVLAVALF